MDLLIGDKAEGRNYGDNGEQDRARKDDGVVCRSYFLEFPDKIFHMPFYPWMLTTGSVINIIFEIIAYLPKNRNKNSVKNKKIIQQEIKCTWKMNELPESAL